MPFTQFRPLDLGEILDGAFTLYRRHFATLFSTALLGFLPMMAMMLLLFPMGMAAESGGDAASAVMIAGFVVLAPLLLGATLLMWGALIRQVSQAYLGEEVSVRDGFTHAFRTILPLTGAGLLSLLAVAAGLLLCIVPGVLLMLMLFAGTPAVVLEGRGPVEALGRSRQLAEGAWGQIFLVFLVISVITYVPGMALGFIVMFGMVAVQFLAEGSEAAMLAVLGVSQVLNVLVGALTTPFTVLGLVLLYYDRRVRTEGLDLEMATGRLAAPA